MFSGETPLANNLFLKASKSVDFPQRLIPVITFIRFWSFSWLNLFIYISRFIIYFFIANNFIKNNQSNTTLEHEGEIEGLTTVESWIVEDIEKDKSKLFDFNVPLGTWMVSMKVENEDVWNKLIKSGEVKGFSIEGYFIPELRENLSKETLSKAKPIDEYEKKVNEVKKILNLI